MLKNINKNGILWERNFWGAWIPAGANLAGLGWMQERTDGKMKEKEDVVKEKIGKNAYYIKSGKYAGLVEKDGRLCIVYDKIEIPDEIKNMSPEERQRRIKILEEQGREAGKNIPDPKLLLAE